MLGRGVCVERHEAALIWGSLLVGGGENGLSSTFPSPARLPPCYRPRDRETPIPNKVDAGYTGTGPCLTCASTSPSRRQSWQPSTQEPSPGFGV